MQQVAQSMARGTEHIPEVEPFNWHSPPYALPGVIGGWSVEVWNPVTKAWDRNPNAPRWPFDYEDAARDWVDLANADQRERNAAVAAHLAGA